MAALQNENQSGFFFWENMLLSIFLLAMAATVSMYVKAAELQAVEAVTGRADYLARSQISYAQALLAREGNLPQHMDYQGAIDDLQQNDSRYQVMTEAIEDGGLWQLTITVFWEVKGRYGKQEYKRSLVRYK